jgi:hypothetical protein
MTLPRKRRPGMVFRLTSGNQVLEAGLIAVPAVGNAGTT